MDRPQIMNRYHVLHNEDDLSEVPPSIQEDRSEELSRSGQSEDPPPYPAVVPGEEYGFQNAFPVPSAPPPYSVATSLPTYDEVEKAAAMETSVVSVVSQGDFPPQHDLSEADRVSVGTDRMFMLAFFAAFFFNWIGVCLSICLTKTIAARYGAFSGFGLSLVQWILIIRFLDYFNLYVLGHYWLWWILLVFGLLLFFRGLVNYLKVRNISENMTTRNRIRFYFLY